MRNEVEFRNAVRRKAKARIEKMCFSEWFKEDFSTDVYGDNIAFISDDDLDTLANDYYDYIEFDIISKIFEDYSKFSDNHKEIICETVKDKCIKKLKNIVEELRKEEKEMRAIRTEDTLSLYEEYKKQWVEDHISEETSSRVYNEYLEYLADDDTPDDYTFDDYLFEFGYNGIIYACYDEWLDNEYSENR